MPAGNRLADAIGKEEARARGWSTGLLDWFRSFLSDPSELQAPLTYEDYEGYIVPLEGQLGGTVGNDFDEFTVPSTHNLLVTEIRHHLGWASDPNADAAIAFGAATLDGRPDLALIQKAANTKIDLKILDRQRKVVDNVPLSLLDLYTKDSIKFRPAPMIIPAGYKIRMDLTAVTATAVAQGTDFNAGLVLVGALARC